MAEVNGMLSKCFCPVFREAYLGKKVAAYLYENLAW